jgi:hypothetical protein
MELAMIIKVGFFQLTCLLLQATEFFLAIDTV